MKIVIDSNVWVSALLSRMFRTRLLTIISDNQIVLLGHTELIAEIEEVTKRPKITKYVTKAQVDEFIQILKTRVEFVEFKNQLTICRDEADNYLLALATEHQAQYLITGDKDLLVLNPYANVEIITLTQFEQLRKEKI